MDNAGVQLVGGPCGQHGPYTFYKAFRFTKNGEKHIVTLSEFFFVKLWMDSDLVCIGELHLLWVDKNSEQVLASLRLYFLPENTPDGRMDHGEDEVLAISEKVVLRVEDLITWITLDADWSWGRLAKYADKIREPFDGTSASVGGYESIIGPRLTDSALDFSDVEKEKKLLGIKPRSGPQVIILSYPRYCRYRAVMKRLEGVEDEFLKHKIVYALGGIRVPCENTRILFCKETFDYPELEGHELLCNHLAPKLKGRPRGKRKKRSISPGSESNESESSVSNVTSAAKNKITTEGGRNGLRCDTTTSPRRSTRAIETTESKDFIKLLTTFMKNNKTPIGRIPSLGYRELDLYLFYLRVEKLGGYDLVTANRLWKSIFDDLTGNHSSTSAATVIRRHYERFLLPYERHVKGEEHKPLPVSERRRLKSKAGSSSASDAEMSEGTSRSGNSTPVPQHLHPPSVFPITPSDNKDAIIKVEAKPSALRSVRVKPDRLRENMKDKPIDTTPISNPYNFEPPESLKEEAKLQVPEKDPEPTTGAVAPVQKLSPEKSISPVEGKENIPMYNALESQVADNMNDDLIEVPYKPNSSELIDLESSKYNDKINGNNNNNNNSNLVNNNQEVVEVKKGKLDILKEGGLEVTPVRGFVSPINKDNRPSVIQGTKPMPPPTIHATLIKRPMHSESPVLPMQCSPKPIKPPPSPKNFNGTTPPKVVQSKSIYAPSPKTIYGDPKDLFMPKIHEVQTPKFVGNLSNSPVTDLLDLTVRSPQKPVVEIMKVPHLNSPKPPVPKNYSHKNTFAAPALPLLEGRRLNSNLEITLVGPSKPQPLQQMRPPQQMPPHHRPHKPQFSNIQPPHSRSNLPNNMVPPPTQKRSMNEYYTPNKYPRREENGNPNAMSQHYSLKMLKPPSNKMDSYMNKSYMPPPAAPASLQPPPPPTSVKHDSVKTPQTGILPNSTAKYPSIPPLYPNYMSHPTSANKGIPSYMPMVDPMYYQALQNFYPPSPLTSVPPIFSMPTPEQLQVYTEYMARNSRMSYPFPYPQENHTSITSLDNNVKKQ